MRRATGGVIQVMTYEETLLKQIKVTKPCVKSGDVVTNKCRKSARHTDRILHPQPARITKGTGTQL